MLLVQVLDEHPGSEDDLLPNGVLGHQDLAAGGPAARMHRMAGKINTLKTLQDNEMSEQSNPNLSNSSDVRRRPLA